MATGIKLGRDDYKKKKELEELRKLGAAPAEVDDEGYIINPHIPQYMAEAPWYLSDGRPGLRHQRLTSDYTKYANVGDVIETGIDTQSKKKHLWEDGCCENCGASTHKTKDCVERPRQIKAKFNNIGLQQDEIIPEKRTYTWDGKRDRWNNFDLATHQLVIERHEKMREFRHQKKMEELDKAVLEGDEKAQKKLKKMHKKKDKAPKKTPKNKTEITNNNDNESDDDSDSDNEGDSDSDESDWDSDDDLKDRGEVIQRFDSKKRQTIRNLRLREDLPKYLRNYDLDSAYYDPKTRALRDDPYKGMERTDELYHGDNTVRVTGDAVKFNEIKRFAWDTREVNAEHLEGAVHLQANPTLAEKAYRSFQERKKGIKNEHRDKILQKYGGEEHLQNPQKELLYGQSEAYAEYSHDGRIIHGLGVYVPKSKYNEDIYPGNHKSVWGSWYNMETGEWGYACCHVTLYHGYCTGQTGLDSAETNDGAASDNETGAKDEESRIPPSHQTSKQIVGVAARPKELMNKDKLVNPSGYVSTRGYQPGEAVKRRKRLRETTTTSGTDGNVVGGGNGAGGGIDGVGSNTNGSGSSTSISNAGVTENGDVEPPLKKRKL